MLCSTCLAALQELKHAVAARDDHVRMLHHGTIAGLAQAASSGCLCCRTLWVQLSELDKTRLLASDGDDRLAARGLPACDDKSLDAMIWRNHVEMGCGTTCGVRATRDVVPPDYMTFEIHIVRKRQPLSLPVSTSTSSVLFVLKPCPQKDKDCPSSKPSGSINTASKESWALAERWLSDCNVSHQRCTSLHNNHWLPTRLLDLEGHKLKNTARLVDRCDAPRSARYVTLSHRWGSHIPVYLNKATELQLRAGIQVGALSQAFQDAIEISLRLQVRYIWIDSLCIMQDQDDLRDWMKEAATMNQVYMHSYLNISSLAASDSNSSFFAERNPDSTQETHVETRLKECQLGETWLKYHVSDVKWMERNIEDTPLNRRAWVLQERLISPRVLHFGREQLVWECIETERAESCPEGLPRLYTKWGFKSTLYDYNPWKEIGPHSGPALQKEPYHSWNRVVQVYSKCSMTKSEDKLIAIAGIAKQMANIVQDEYVCGMWRRCLPSMLLWLVADRQQANGSLPHRPTEYRAPSFSWASVDGVIAPGHPDNHDLLFEVLDVKLAFATEDITGLVTGGSLLLKGQVQRLSIRPNTSGNSVFEHIASVNGVDVVPADVSFTPIWLDEHETYFDPNAADQETLFCVPAREDGEVQYMEVLPLQVVDATEGTYRRFGLSCVRTKREREVFRRPPKEPVNIPAVAVEDGMHIIRLI